jgi:hypothetical protein
MEQAFDYRYTFPTDAQRRPSRFCIRFFIEEAVAKKRDAWAKPEPKFATASQMSCDGWWSYRRDSILKMARASMRYHRNRAYLGKSQGGNPRDPSDTQDWKRLQAGHLPVNGLGYWVNQMAAIKA